MGAGGRQFRGYAYEYLPPSDLAGWATAHTARHALARRWSLSGTSRSYPRHLAPDECGSMTCFDN